MDSFICQVHGLFAHPLWTLPILNSSVIAAVIAFGLPSVYLYWQHKNKIKASIDLLAHYATIAIRHIEYANSKEKNDEITENIVKGSPFGESGKNYTPFILLSEEDKLSFDQIREILQYLKKEEREHLVEYFTAQAKLDAICQSINSEFVRSLPQERKKRFWNLHLEYRKELLEKAKALTRIIKRRKISNKFRFRTTH